MILSDLLAEVIKIEPPVEEICEMDDPVAGEMYLPGVTVKMSKTPGRIGPVPTPGQHTRRPAARRHDRLRTRVARGAASNGRRGRRRPSLRSRAAPALPDSRPRAARSRLLAS